MRSLMRRGGRAAVAMTVISLAVTGAALANATTYKGETSQKHPVSFTILNGHIRDLKIVIHDKCPALPGQVAPPLIKTDSFPPIEIKDGMFHGLFRSRTSNADHANLHGRVEAREVTGRLEDTGTNREGVHCFGSVTFTAHPV